MRIADRQRTSQNAVKRLSEKSVRTLKRGFTGIRLRVRRDLCKRFSHQRPYSKSSRVFFRQSLSGSWTSENFCSTHSGEPGRKIGHPTYTPLAFDFYSSSPSPRAGEQSPAAG